MTTETIDHNTLTRLVEARAVRGAHVIGQPGGWGVVVKHGRVVRSLAATRSQEVRVFKRLETLVRYLKGLGISRFDVDADDFDPQTVVTYKRPDASAALKRAHEAAVHDKWFREQVALGIKEADDPATQWVPHEVVKADMARQRVALRARTGKGKL
jgi:hypothetical protein